MMKALLEKTALLLVLAGTLFSFAFRQGLPVFQGEFNSVDGSLYVARSIELLIAFSIFLAVSFYAVPTWLSRGRFVHFLLVFFAVFLLAVGVEWLLDLLTKVVFNLPLSADQVSDKRLMYVEHRTLSANLLAQNVVVALLALLYGILRDWVAKMRFAQQAEREKVRAELNYLRSQVNPHFLFNTLNTIYAMTQKSGDQDSQKAVLLLSDSMRYMLYDSEQELVELGRELDQIKHYLELVQLRFGQTRTLVIELTSELDDDTLPIAPLLLLPFVENAVKHGLGKGGEGEVRVRIKGERGRLQFNVENSVPPEPSSYRKQVGIGVDNVRKRLALLYPNRHELKIGQKDGRYRVTLSISLQE